MLEEARPPAVDERIGVDPEAEFRLARRTCVDCASYHALRPYLRASGSAGGVGNDWAQMEPAVARLIDEGRRRVLVIGAGDSGTAALTLTAARGRPIQLTVIDRCATPLVQVQRLGARHGLRVTTRQDDLLTFDLPDAFDLVVGHHVLQFLPPGGPTAMLGRAARALAPGGRLLMVTRERAWKTWRDKAFAQVGETYEAAYVEEVLTRIEQRKLQLPRQDQAAFDAYLRAAARNRVQRAERYHTAEHFAAQLDAAGFVLESSIDLRHVPPGLATKSPVEPPRAGVIAVARPRRHDPR